MPRIVEEWILFTPFKNVEEVYFVMDCGGNIGNAGHYNRKLCEEKGFNYKGTMEIIMPENYLAMFDTPEDDEAQNIIKQADPVIKQTASYIHQHLPFPKMSLQLKDKFQSSIVNTVFYPLFVKADAFYSTDECIGCGLCETLCPLHNIQIKDHHPVWDKECTHCMACIARCSKKAIEYGKKSIGKNRYYLD
ncbi:EFR1 family ferrodoxin [uncultured Catenibacterium sp.]|uniref:EFR1 family ferrodoxin n=1 Tax=uncultured Catenibacterium sp. TaxID=286142 RepID=UPI0034578EDA